MKKFIGQILVFTIGLLLINLVIFQVVNEYYYEEYGQLHIDSKFHTYILADSHGLCFSDTLEEVGIKNLSIASESYIDMHRKLKYLIQYSEIKNVILTVDDHTLSTYREINSNSDRSVVFADKIEDYKNGYTFLVDRYIKRYLPLFNGKSRDIAILALESKIGKKKEKKSNEEFFEIDIWKNSEYRVEYSTERAKKQFGEEIYSSEQLIETLNKIIVLCQDNNINLIGLKFPLTQDYLNIIKDKSFGADLIFKNNGIEVLDYKHKMKHDDTYFYNQDHLNYYGGQQFEKDLFFDLENRGLLKK